MSETKQMPKRSQGNHDNRSVHLYGPFFGELPPVGSRVVALCGHVSYARPELERKEHAEKFPLCVVCADLRDKKHSIV